MYLKRHDGCRQLEVAGFLQLVKFDVNRSLTDGITGVAAVCVGADVGPARNIDSPPLAKTGVCRVGQSIVAGRGLSVRSGLRVYLARHQLLEKDPPETALG